MGLARSLLVIICLFVSAQPIVRSDEAHAHQGLLKPYIEAPPSLLLSDLQRYKLADGEAIFLRQKIGKAQRGVAVFQVAAPTETVWSVIKEFRSYPQWIEDIDSVDIYREFGNLIFVRFTARGPFGNTVWYVRHNYPRDDRNWGSWRLDYDNRSDIYDSVGYWRVLPVSDGISEVIYSADIRLSGIASWFEGSIIKDSLKNASIWVKREAESQALKKQ